MVHQFSSSHDKGQSMVIHPKYMSSSYDNGQSMVVSPSCMKHAPSVFIVS